jgi:metallo-beta-lactamase family protein
MKVTFCGAAGIVTGSCYLVESGNTKILVDCGMFQGPKDVTRMNYLPFLFDPRKISHVLLTHAHIDHSWLIPRLFRKGFSGKVLCTAPTRDLSRIMLEDSAYVNEKDVEDENRRRKREGLAPREPLFTMADAKKSLRLFSPVSYGQEVQIAGGMRARFRDAGHILGSSIIELFVEEGGKETKLVFSGDLGQWDAPIVQDPTLIKEADYVFIESTYGDTSRESSKGKEKALQDTIAKTYKRRGKLMIPSFAVERTQELLYYIHRLIDKGKFPKESVFLDSPLAIKATEVFQKHGAFYDEETRRSFATPFTFARLENLVTTRDSMKLNDYPKPCVIMAGSGMCTGGRIRHHLRHHLGEPENTLLFVGYQAEGTLGRHILDGAKRVRMMGMEVEVKSKIERIEGFSAHADAEELLRWAEGFGRKPRKIFVVHGELGASTALARRLNSLGYETHIPKIGETVELG